MKPIAIGSLALGTLLSLAACGKLESPVVGMSGNSSSGSSAPFATPANVAFGILGAINTIGQDENAWYVGGQFTAAGQTLVNGLLALTPGGDVASSPCLLAARFNSTVNAVAFTAGSIYVGGNFTTYNLQEAPYLAKISRANCSLDPTFHPPGAGGFDGQVSALLVDGTSLFVGGQFENYRGVAGAANNIAKLDLNSGALNTTFSPPGANGFDYSVLTIAEMSGALYVGGYFTAYRGAANSALRIAKLDPATGALDITFSPPGGNGFDSDVQTILADGTDLYVGGTFSAYRGVADSAFGLAKLDPTSGTLNTTFSPPGAGANGFDNRVYTLAADGSSLYVGGDFTSYRGVSNSANRIAKIDKASGTLDPIFGPPGANGFNSDVNSLQLLGSALYAVGDFSLYQGNAVRTIAKLDASTGTRDGSFGPTGQPLAYFDSEPNQLAVDGGMLYAIGGFTAYGGFIANRIAKFSKTTGALDLSFSPQAGPNGFDNEVDGIAVAGQKLLITGQSFTQYRGVSVRQPTFLDKDTGALIP